MDNRINPKPFPSVIVTNEDGVQSFPVPHQSQQTEQNIDSDEKYNCLAYSRQNQNQTYALSAANIIMIAGGLNISWSLYVPLDAYVGHVPSESQHLYYSWFVGVLIGALFSILSIRSLPRKYFTYSGSVLIILNGLLYAILPSNSIAILAGRYLGGTAHGLVFLMAVIHAGEISVKNLRGCLVSSINISITLGICLSAAFIGTAFSTTGIIFGRMGLIQTYGIALCVLGCIAFILTIFLSYESPINLIDKGDENIALKEMLRLRKKITATEYLYEEFREYKVMLHADKDENFLSRGSLVPLFIVIIMRFVFAYSTNASFNALSVTISANELESSYGFLILIFSRLAAEIISFYLVDRIGRKALLFSTALCGATILTLIIPENYIFVSTDSFIKCLIYYIFLGFGLGAVSITYMSESFSTVTKQFYIFAGILVENLFYLLEKIVFLSVDMVDFKIYLIIMGTLQIIFGVSFCILCPETKRLSLYECRKLFKGEN